MVIYTRDFGEMEVDEREIIEFRAGIFGFEEANRFVLLSDDSIPALTWLQSVEHPHICFIVVNPGIVDERYKPQLSDETRELLALEDAHEARYLAIAVIPKEFADTTVNLKSPIVVNPRTKLAAQVILEQDYPIRAFLLGEGRKGVC